MKCAFPLDSKWHPVLIVMSTFISILFYSTWSTTVVTNYAYEKHVYIEIKKIFELKYTKKRCKMMIQLHPIQMAVRQKFVCRNIKRENEQIMCSCNKFISDSTKREITIPFCSWKPNCHTHAKNHSLYTRITRTIYFGPTSVPSGKPKSLSNKRHQEVNELKRSGETAIDKQLNNHCVCMWIVVEKEIKHCEMCAYEMGNYLSF